MTLIATLLACSAPSGDELRFVEDTSYRGVTKLQQVSSSCSDEGLLVRGRTLGWMEEVLVEVWNGADMTYGKAQSVAYRRDEYCDIFELTLTEHGFGCDAFEDLTYLLRVQFELGCGGMKAWGAESEWTVYGQLIDPEPDGDVDCDLDQVDMDWLRPVAVVSEITPCGEPVE